MNCTGSCSWKIYVKGGIVTWETQQTDYPRTRPDLPNHEPRGCARGASYCWYLYSANRVKYPMIRSRLLKLWRAARATMAPVQAWASIVERRGQARDYQKVRGIGGFVRASWDEVNEIIAAANVYTVKKHGPDRVVGFSPIPAMSMVSYAAGSRYLSLIGGVCLRSTTGTATCHRPRRMTWGEQTDVPESADWYNASLHHCLGLERAADAHARCALLHRGPLQGHQDGGGHAGLLRRRPSSPTCGCTRSRAPMRRWPMAMGHVILREFHLDRQAEYFEDYVAVHRYADAGSSVEKDGRWSLTGCCAPLTSPARRGKQRRMENGRDRCQTATGRATGLHRLPLGRQRQVEPRAKEAAKAVDLKVLSLRDRDDVAAVAFPYFAGESHEHFQHWPAMPCNTAACRYTAWCWRTAVWSPRCSTCRPPIWRSTVAWAAPTSPRTTTTHCARHPGLAGADHWRVAERKPIAREFADNADKTKGRSMIIVGAAMNHWYHMDMNYRGLINMLMLCGCVGQTGGGWSHYVGQEKLRPQCGWLPLGVRPGLEPPASPDESAPASSTPTVAVAPREMSMHDVLSPLADKSQFPEHALDYNIRAERAGWLPRAATQH